VDSELLSTVYAIMPELELESERPAIKSLKSHGETVSVRVDGFERSFLVATTTVHRGNLRVGTVLTSSQLEQLTVEDESLRCHRETVRLLSLRDHTIGELRRKLSRKGFDSNLAENTIGKLRQAGLVDDGKLALKSAKLLLDRKPCGRSYLIAHLLHRAIDRSLAEQAADAALVGFDRTKLARKALENRWSLLQQLELERAKRKAYNYLARRGFSYSEAREAFEALTDDIDNANEVSQD